MFALSNETNFGIPSSSHVIANLKAAKHTTRDLTTTDLRLQEHEESNVLGAVKKGNNIIYLMATYYTNDLTGKIEVRVFVYGDKELFLDKNMNTYDFAEAFGSNFSSFPLDNVYEVKESTNKDITKTVILAQLSQQDNVEILSDEDKGLRSVSKHIWMDMKKEELFKIEMNETPRKTRQNTQKSFNIDLANNVIFGLQQTTEEEKYETLLNLYYILYKQLKSDCGCKFDHQKLESKLNKLKRKRSQAEIL